MSVNRRWPAGLVGEATAVFAIGAIVSGMVWLWWWATPIASGPTDVIAAKVVSITIKPGYRVGNRVVMLASAEGTQIGITDRTSGFPGCKVGSDIKIRRIKTATGFIGYKFVPGSCSS